MGTVEIKRVGVVGLGTMGSGIVEVVARNGYQVVGVDLAPDHLKQAQQRMSDSMERGVARGKLTDGDREEITSRISYSTALQDLASCDLVIEAATEDLDIKRQIFSTLGSILAEQAILATNTSALSVTEISVSTD